MSGESETKRAGGPGGETSARADAGGSPANRTDHARASGGGGFELDQLKLAFAYHLVREIIGADGALSQSEEGFLARAFPPHALETSGFLDRDGNFTEAYQVAVDEALAELPGRLDLTEKLGLVDMFFGATLADDQFHHSEGDLLVLAARLLGLSTSQLDEHLSSLSEVGEVDLPDPEV